MDIEDNMLTDEEVSSIEEGTAAANTLKPGGGSGGSESKAEMLSTFVSLMSQLGKEDLSKFMNDALAQIGKEADVIPGGAAASNKNTIKAKPSAASAIKEDLEEVFSEEEDFSEEFKEKASTIFEALVNTRINLETVRLEEEFAERAAELEEQFEEDLQEKANEIFEQLTEKLDQYLNYNVETYIEENKVALTSALRAEIAENFIFGLQNLFTEHYITVPEEKIDILGEMKAEIEDLKAKLNETINEKLEISESLEALEKEKIISEVSQGLADTQRDRLKNLAESVEYSDTETFKNKMEIIKESYFGRKSSVKETGLITEEIDGSQEDKNEGSVSPVMEKYLEKARKLSR